MLRQKKKKMKKICVFTVRRPSIIFGPDPKLLYCTFSNKLFKYHIFAFQCSMCCLRPNKNMFVSCYIGENYWVGRSGFLFFYIFFFLEL